MQRTLLLSLSVLLWSASAHAADTPKLVVIPFTVGEGASESATARFNAQLSEAFKSRDDEVTVVGGPQTRPAERTGAAKKAPSPEAVAAIAAGKKALEELRFDEAMEKLKKGVELQLADPASADHAAITEAQLQLAVAAFRLGEEKEAQSALQAIARTTVGFAVPAGFPPVFAREFEKAKKRLDKQPKGTVSIEGPAGSTAFVDGRDLGMVPVLEEDLAMGAHAVRVEGTKGERFGQTVELKGGIVKVKASFGAAPPPSERQPARVQDPAVAATLDEATAARVATYARAAQADFALVGVVYRSGDTQLTAGSALYSIKRQGFTLLPPIAFDTEALTSNVEAFKLVDALVKRLDAFGTVASVPFALAQRARSGTVAAVTPVKDVEGVSAPRPVLIPKEPKLAQAPIELPVDEPPPAEIKSGVPVWVWVVVGVGVAAGAGVGGYFGYKAATRPVTGTVNASW